MYVLQTCILYVCIYVVCTYVMVFPRIHEGICVCIVIRVYTYTLDGPQYMNVCICVLPYACMYLQPTWLTIHECMHSCIAVCVYVPTRYEEARRTVFSTLYTCHIHACIYTWMCLHTCHTCKHVCTHSHKRSTRTPSEIGYTRLCAINTQEHTRKTTSKAHWQSNTQPSLQSSQDQKRTQTHIYIQRAHNISGTLIEE